MTIRKTIASALLLFTVGLMTACSGGDTPSETPTEPPVIVANAGPDQSVFIGTFVTLNGSKSTNANGTGLTYAWIMDKPASSKATLSNPAAINPTFTADAGGTYEATLVVTGDQQNSAPDTVIVTASGTNPPPVANAGTSPLNALTGRAVLLNGRGSSDANGDPLTFLWRIAGKPAGSTPILLDAATVAPSFIPGIAGTYTLNLVVNDGTSSSTEASVTINALDKPSPTANAGPDQFVLPNTALVTLNGSNSHTDPKGEELTYAWTINSSTFPVNLQGADSAIATFNLPQNTAGTVVAQLQVTEPNHPDPMKKTTFDTVMVTVGPLASIKVFKLSDLTNPILVCDVTKITCETTVPVNTPLSLDSTGSLALPLTYRWSVTSPLGLTLSKPTDSVTPFTPTGAISYSIQLMISELNDSTKSVTQSFTIMAKDRASADFTWLPDNPGPGTPVTLIPTDTRDGLTYKWDFVPPQGSKAALSEAADHKQTFTVDKAGDYSVTLTVTDQFGPSAPKMISRHIKPTTAISVTPNPPHVCSTVTLTGTSSSDSDSSKPSYTWTLTKPEDSTSALSSNSSPTTTFKADKKAVYTVSLLVTDSSGATNTTSKMFTPVPNPEGESIFKTAGMTPIEGCGKVGCHATSFFDLKDESAIRTAVTANPNKMSGPTSLTGQALTDAIHDLKVFLNSTKGTCP